MPSVRISIHGDNTVAYNALITYFIRAAKQGSNTPALKQSSAFVLHSGGALLTAMHEVRVA
jgi:hypothetical protein